MGQLSTFTSRWYGEVAWPGWFREKYGEAVHLDGPAIASKHGAKTYGSGPNHGLWVDLPEDIRRAINWPAFGRDHFAIVFMHQTGCVTVADITPGGVAYLEAEGWREVADAAHECDRDCLGGRLR